MRSLIQNFFLALILSWLCFPLLLNRFDEHQSSLAGVVKEDAFIPLSWTTVATGAYQQFAERYVQRMSAMRDYLIKLDNQVNYSIFGQIGASKKPKVILGKQNQLIERSYLRAANRVLKVKPERLEHIVRELAAFQKKLQARGIPFLLLITPNKPEYYPELIADRHRIAGVENRPSLYGQFMPLLNTYGINYFDTAAFLREEVKDTPVFLTTGTHWSEYACCRASSEFLQRLQSLLGKPLTTFTCEREGMRTRPTSHDMDLLQITNLLFPERLMTPAPLVVHKRQRPFDPYRPNIVFEGTSFLWEFFENIDSHSVFGKRDFFYYFRRRHPYPRGLPKPIDLDSFDIEKEIMSRDAVIIEANTAFLHKLGHGLVEFVLTGKRPESRRQQNLLSQ
jgi:hypothetical protein